MPPRKRRGKGAAAPTADGGTSTISHPQHTRSNRPNGRETGSIQRDTGLMGFAQTIVEKREIAGVLYSSLDGFALVSVRLPASARCKRARSGGSSDRNRRNLPLDGCLTVNIWAWSACLPRSASAAWAFAGKSDDLVRNPAP